MNILFIHQNFPGQYKHLAPALARAGHKCVALTLRVETPTDWRGVQLVPYRIRRKPGEGLHPWLVDFESKLLRGESCYLAAREMKAQGFEPDLIVAHPGWGESMFLRDLWPNARIGLYYELYYTTHDGDMGFDPEFPQKMPELEAMRLRVKNLNNMMHLEVGDLGISPTEFQANTYPEAFRDRITVIHDGIDTEIVRPNAEAVLDLGDGVSVTAQAEVITFVNRNLEPYRGYHIFMRALPQLLKERPKARVVLVGGDEVSYGAKPPKGRTWKQIYIDEVRGRIATPDWQRVHFLGRVPYDQFLSLLQVSSAHVYLTYPFVLSWSLIEAMSAGVPIVASDTAPLHEAIHHGETGRLFPFFAPDRLVEEVCGVLEDRDMAQGLGRAARKVAQEKYDLQTVCLPQQMKWIDRLASMEPGRITM
ncbi:glycosyltransferase family 4 protein [Shimia sp. FJ5]|uniref:glycosyltransferase family 4 protein n=1 Tax=Shimia sp. FJ5 TaxID=3079054 RepID=UPI0026276330|nr:glycosyltransferase family 4 protein [Shimia sp. FJ5]MDV4144830.1 glycosyltransferase family 4 protein [Shimia sp. FJ5]